MKKILFFLLVSLLAACNTTEVEFNVEKEIAALKGKVPDCVIENAVTAYTENPDSRMVVIKYTSNNEVVYKTVRKGSWEGNDGSKTVDADCNEICYTVGGVNWQNTCKDLNLQFVETIWEDPRNRVTE